MSSNVKPASAIAASHASMVSDSGGTIRRRPSRDAPMPVIAECSSNFAVVSGALTKRPKSVGAISSVGSGPVCLSVVGRNTGSQTSSILSKVTSTGCPNSSSSGSHSMMLVVRRTRGSSTTATCATTYGGGRSGKPNRWLTVKADSVACPETSRTPMLRLRQYRHTGCGGWINASQSRHSWMRRTPSTACGPEELVLGVEFGKRSGQRTNSEIASLPLVFGCGSGDSSTSG